MKRVIVLALAALIALGLCACGEKDADFTPRLDTQQTATLRISGFMGNFEALDQAINAFNRLYPNVTFFYDHNTIYRLSAYLDNNANTDIFMADNQNITRPDLPDQYVLDWCLDLSQEDMDLSAVQPDALKGGTVDGQLVVLPLAMNPCGIVVNKTLLKNEGLTVPENYSQLLATLEALKAKGYTPLQGSEQHLYGELMLSMAMNLLAQEPQRIDALLSGDAEAAEAVLPAFRRLDAIVHQGYTDYTRNCTYPKDNYDGAIMAFFQGDVPFYVCTSECVSGMKKRESKSEQFSAQPFEYEFLYPPMGDSGAYAYSQSWYGFCVNRHSKNRELAVEFLRFLMTQEQLNAMASIKGMPSASTSGTDTRYAGIRSAKNLQASYINDGTIPDTVRQAFTRACNEFGAGTLKTPEEAAAAFAAYCVSPLE